MIANCTWKSGLDEKATSGSPTSALTREFSRTKRLAAMKVGGASVQ